VWLADDAAGTYGGVYLFTDRASADRTRDTTCSGPWQPTRCSPTSRVREFNVLDETAGDHRLRVRRRTSELSERPATKGIVMSAPATTTQIRVGLFPAALDQDHRDPEHVRATLAHVAAAGVDHLCVGDHVSFFRRSRSDGLITASALLAAQSELPVYVALYLLPLRHRSPSGGSLATIAELTPDRLTLGVGIGGEDRQRGRDLRRRPKDPRTADDESLHI